ncbi:MAG: hypothetical protein LUD72_06385 [Bacteroidales bacterium]|nr:hypothetical protein [Bacteroidales bacterium]
MKEKTFTERAHRLWEIDQKYRLSVNLLKFDTNTTIRNLLEKCATKEINFPEDNGFPAEGYNYKKVEVKTVYVDQDDGNGCYTPIMYEDIIVYDIDDFPHSIYGEDFDQDEAMKVLEDIVKLIKEEWKTN